MNRNGNNGSTTTNNNNTNTTTNNNNNNQDRDNNNHTNKNQKNNPEFSIGSFRFDQLGDTFRINALNPSWLTKRKPTHPDPEIGPMRSIHLRWQTCCVRKQLSSRTKRRPTQLTTTIGGKWAGLRSAESLM